MEDTEYSQQRQEEWRNTSEAKQVKVTDTDKGEGTPAPERYGSDEEAGNGEKNLDAELAVPDQGVHKLGR